MSSKTTSVASGAATIDPIGIGIGIQSSGESARLGIGIQSFGVDGSATPAEYSVGIISVG